MEAIPFISFVIPVHNEENNVSRLHEEILAVCRAEGYQFEVIFVDDGSRDGTYRKLQKLKPIRIIQLRKNFGQTAALDAGIRAAKGDFIVTMDGDLQNDPADVPNLYRELQSKDLDVVSGWRISRKDSFAKRFVSAGARILRRRLINDGIHDSGCTLKIYRSECFEGLRLYGEMHRFIPAVLMIKGFRVGELPVNHRPRVAGLTKYNWRRTFKGFIDMVSVWFWNKYAVRPLHLLGGFGLIIESAGMMSAGYTFYQYVSGVNMSDTAWPILTAFLLIFGVQLFISGLQADIAMKSYFGATGDGHYSIRRAEENT
jgi:glycosyltransferase involved in cell wall biosynthesis